MSNGETGEIWVRSRHMMVGYWGEPGETAEALRDGWLRTRDLGYLDGRGFLHLTGRTRDVIMVNAWACYAGPIERVLASHPDVDQGIHGRCAGPADRKGHPRVCGAQWRPDT